MFIAMNRFQVGIGSEAEFETVWRDRDSQLENVPGFVRFHLLKGPKTDGHTLYASHTIWASQTDFENWTRSSAFRKAHANTGGTKTMYSGHPVFEGFEVIQSI